MRIRTNDAQYVLAVINGLADGAVPSWELTDVCPECGEKQSRLDNYYHLVVVEDEDDHDGPVVVVIGCEGYHVINPNLVGVAHPDWQDWKIDQWVDLVLDRIRNDVAAGVYDPFGPPTSTADLPADWAHEVAEVPWNDDEGGRYLLEAFYNALDDRLKLGLNR